MDEIYLNLLALLTPQEIPTAPKQAAIYNQLKKLQQVDMDKGQLEFYDTRPAVAFPCALIKVEITQTESLGNNIQRCYGRGTIRVAFDYTGQTSLKTPDALQEQSLDYFEILKGIYSAVQGKTAGAGKFDRQSAIEEQRTDGLKVLNMPFTTVWLDQSASQ